MPAYRLLMTTDTVGGVWRYAIDLARELAATDVAVTLAALGPPASRAQRCEAEAVSDFVDTGLPLDWLCEDISELAAASAALAGLANERSIDLVQSNSPLHLEHPAGFEAPIAALHHSCLATWWSAVKREPLATDWEWRKRLTSSYLRKADAVAAPSQAFADASRSTYDLQRRLRVIRNGRPPPPAVDGGLSSHLLSAGRLWDEGKGIATLDRAARKLTVPVYVAGPLQGPNGARVQTDYLRPLGDLSETEMRARFAERPLFVSTSLYEPFGLAVLEAAQAGCPLLLADIPSFRELWDGAALFFPPGDDAILAETAAALIADYPTRQALGTAAREHASAYSLKRCAQATQQWHREILAARLQKRGAA